MSSNKILIIRGGAIGDFILTLPVLAALRAQLPKARLEVLGYPHIAQLALAGGLSDAVRSIEARPLAGFFARKGALDPALEEYFAGFAIVISYLFDPDEIFQANVARCSKAQFIAGPHRPDETAGIHATKVFLKPLERLAIFDADPEPKLFINPISKTGIRSGSGAGVPPVLTGVSPVSSFPDSTPLVHGRDARQDSRDGCPTTAPTPEINQIALHPGSGSERKNWPEENWGKLLQELISQTGLTFLLVGGEAEGERLERLAVGLPVQRVAVARSLPLPELAMRLRSCRAFLGHDSGITHLAAAVGLPGLVLWGDTMETVWRPQSERLKILRDQGGLQQLPVMTVRTELENLLRQTRAAW